MRSLRLTASETLTVLSPRQRNAKGLRRRQGDCYRSFSELSKATFTKLNGAIVPPHLEHAMEANSLNLRADINYLMRVQRLATRLVRGLHHVLYEDRLRLFHVFSLTSRPLQVNLIVTCKISRCNSSKPVWFLTSSTLKWAERAHIQNTASAKPVSMKKQ